MVSIIIPCFNAEAFIAEAITSALVQTYQDCEIIVIDDGSTDSSIEFIKSFGDSIHWETGPNRGGCAARNRGLSLARGEWIQFLDADDRIAPDKIAAQVRDLTGLPAGSVATCAWTHFTAESSVQALEFAALCHSYDRGIDLLVEMWLTGGYFVPHCWLVPRELLTEVGDWNEALKADQDGEFFGRVLAAAGNVVFTSDVEAFYRTPGLSNVSSSKNSAANHSRLHSWEVVAKKILEKRIDSQARRAVLRRLRSLAYGWLQFDSTLLEKAVDFEEEHWMFDFDPNLPAVSRLLLGLLGINRGIQIRRRLRGLNR